MIRLRRARDRHRLTSGDQKLWLTFFPGVRSDPLANGFGALTALNEGLLRPEGNMLTYSRRGSEVITYVMEGTMAHQDRGRRSKLIRAGEFQCSSAKYSDSSIFSNASGREQLRVLQLSLLSREGVPSARDPQQKSFLSLPSEPRFCLVGSSDGREGSLALGQNVLLYSGTFRAGRAFTYPLAPGRIAWMQMLSGKVMSGPTLLDMGDGAGFSSDHGLSLQAMSDAEVVLLDLEGDASGWFAQTDFGDRGTRGISGANCAA